MTPTVTLTLDTPQGAFQFAGAEVPEQIAIGGAQMLCTHKMIGGLRIVDAMGPDDAPLSWSGIFLYDDAAPRAQFLDYIRRSGLPCTLTWGDYRYAVVVSEFTADFRKPYWIPFRIACEVVQDQTQNVTSIAPTAPADALAQDCASVNQLAAALALPSLSSLTASASAAIAAVSNAAAPIAGGLVALSSGAAGALSGAVSSVASSTASSIASGAVAAALSTLSGAASGVAGSALGGAIAAAAAPMAALQAGVQNMVAGAEAVIAAVPTLGGITAGQPVAGQLAGLAAQAVAAVQLPALQQIAALTTRMQANLALVANPSGNNQVLTGGGNLYQLAAQTYGDASRWSDIAQASGIADPMTTGFNTVTLPA